MTAVSLLTAAALLTFTSLSAGTMRVAQSPMCAIDMGSNTFRRITGSIRRRSVRAAADR